MMSPLGIGIGISVMEAQLEAEALIQAVLEGLAAGTFVYITFLEILPHELNSPGQQLLKVFFILLGFSIMAALTFLGWDPSEHVLESLCQLLQLPRVCGWHCFRKTRRVHEKSIEEVCWHTVVCVEGSMTTDVNVVLLPIFFSKVSQRSLSHLWLYGFLLRGFYVKQNHKLQ